MSRFDPDTLARALAAAGLVPVAPAGAAPWDEAVEIVVGLCKRFEGFRSRPYLCPAAVPTIGYGATHYLDGRRVTLKDPPISEPAAERLLRLQVERVYLPAVLRQCPRALDHGPGLLAALGDFTFNLGEGRLAASTLRRKVNAGDLAAVPAELRKWVYGGGKVLRGLVIRREAEIAVLG